ncbi:MAG TPA: BTAD domain-containing putative transcriptional regulator [Pseudonocardiaceae bacterium]|jgi:DNA-binding SARP family transcriptional activator/Tfp pilus assembly protein PilF|nr:BTAD domain-containing putative transcriptional regulator [Pseudonocardiaceae bacterium]
MAVRFRLLGTVEAELDGRPVDIGHARQQCVLISLLIDANRSVSADQLVDRVWGDRQLPDQPRNALQTYVSLLRRAFTGTDEVRISRQPGGYLLSVDPEKVDLHRFRQLVAAARGTDELDRGTDLLDEALSLFGGRTFGNLDTPWLAAVRTTVDSERHAARLELNDLRLRRGEHADLLAPLAALADEQPFDERLAGQLIVALHRSGRQADALAHYDRLRDRLADELGTDVSPSLRRVHQQLQLHATADEDPPADPARPVAPRQLPAPPRLFVGRTAELTQLDKVLDAQAAPGGTVLISAIGGAGGIGKTWLALHWAHLRVDRFPDGQLYVNLHGFDPSDEPLPPAVALRGFLDALGVDPVAVPVDLEAQAALYRSLVADRRLLVVLDNARDAAQAVPLLPGSASCTVLVTSRSRLTGLVAGHGAYPLSLDVLSEHEARDLLARHLGHDRVDAEPVAASELVARCAGLPLALGIVAARAAARPDFALAVLAEELRAAADRLDALATDDLTANVRAVLSWSHDALSPTAASTFGMLGLAPGPDISLPAAAALIAATPSAARLVLRELENAHLVAQHVPGRYRMHDLVRLYATEQAEQAEQAPTDALRRLTDFYLHTAFAGQQILFPHHAPIELDPAAPGGHPLRLADEPTALAWFSNEHPILLATQLLAEEQRWDRTTWQLASTLDTFLRRRGHVADHLLSWQRGLAAADRLGRPAERLLARRFLGTAYARVGRHADAQAQLAEALALAETAGNETSLAHTLRALAPVCGQRGDHRAAVDHATRALAVYQRLGDREWESDTLNLMGWYSAHFGAYDQARTHCTAALELARRHGLRSCAANALDSLGFVAHRTADHRGSLANYQQALAIWRVTGDSYEEADTLDRLAGCHLALGQPRQARECWRSALELYENQHRVTDADRVRLSLLDGETRE